MVAPLPPQCERLQPCFPLDRYHGHGGPEDSLTGSRRPYRRQVPYRRYCRWSLCRRHRYHGVRLESTHHTIPVRAVDAVPRSPSSSVIPINHVGTAASAVPPGRSPAPSPANAIKRLPPPRIPRPSRGRQKCRPKSHTSPVRPTSHPTVELPSASPPLAHSRTC